MEFFPMTQIHFILLFKAQSLMYYVVYPVLYFRIKDVSKYKLFLFGVFNFFQKTNKNKST